MGKTITVADDVAKTKKRIEGELLKRGVKATYSDVFRVALEISGDKEIIERIEREEKGKEEK